MTRGKLIQHVDYRGILTAMDISTLPYHIEVKRFFFVSKVPDGTTRGTHAHKKNIQVLICIAGEISVEVSSKDYEGDQLMEPGDFLILEPLEWSRQEYFDDAILLVLCSEPYDESDYIRDYDEFKKLAGI